MRMLAAVVLLCLWPFHRHRHVAAVTRNVSTITVVGAEDLTPQDRQGCDMSPDVGFVWAGDDGMVGTSEVSCEAAFQDWRHSPLPPHRFGLI